MCYNITINKTKQNKTKRKDMLLFKKSLADKLEAKIIELSTEFRDEYQKRHNQNYLDGLEQKVKSNKFKAAAGFVGATVAGVASIGGVFGVAAGAIATTAIIPVVGVSTVIGITALGYAGIKKLVADKANKELLDNYDPVVGHKLENKFESKLRKLLSKTGDSMSEQLNQIKDAIKNNDMNSYEKAINDVKKAAKNKI